MKFLCDNCKAKYQIADEKVTGRKLRMKCRKCGHDIIIQGQGGSAAAIVVDDGATATPSASVRPPAPSAAPRAGRGGSSVGPLPSRTPPARPPQVSAPPRMGSPRAGGSALGADFRRGLAAPSEAPSRPSPLDQWHVAINDVPVGPIKRDELTRKIAAGAVNGDSLAWREGFDDWRPLKDIPELASLLRRPVTAPPKSMPAPRPAPARSHTARPAPAPRPSNRPASPSSSPGRVVAPEPQRPAARSNVVPIGGRFGAAAIPAVDEAYEEQEAQPTRVSASPFAEPEAPAQSGPVPATASAASSSDFPEPSTTAAGQAFFGSAGLPAAGAASLSPPAASAPIPSAIPDPFATPSMQPPAQSPAVAPAPAKPAKVVDPLDSVAPPRRRRADESRGGLIFMLVAGGVFLMAAGVIFGVKILAKPAEPAQPQIVERVVERPVEVIREVVREVPAAAQAEGASGGTKTVIKRVATPRPGEAAGGAVAAAQPQGNQGGIDFSQFQDGTDVNLGGGRRLPQEPSQSDIRRVVNNGQLHLRNCYDRELRRTGGGNDVRVDVGVVVAPAGNVSRANLSGNASPELTRCLDQAVRRWTFPESVNGVETQFPVVFQGTR